MSVFLEEIFEREGKTALDLLARWPGYRLCWLTVDEIEKNFNQQLIDLPDETFPGHAVVHEKSGGRRSQPVRTEMSRLARWYPDSGESDES